MRTHTHTHSQLHPHAAPASRHGTRVQARGFTLIELIVVMAIVALLVSIVAPRYFNSLQKSRETSVRTSLNVMRDAIDQYAADKGRYPDSLAALATARYIREVPEDALTASRDTWVTLAPPADAQISGEVYDVRSGAAGRGSDGRLFADW
ncbi:type II secretion system protein [Roseateles koreensis]|uniref:Prepilin-type N-terminal cleavage/methylation domain-containing protein n=1 Tax=Roseateles koreensis TaxID=2987526 RepID=A0ABT5KTD6_9BURK|nr:prepilin-type N-terminal cleavage/methylation domain-containing protein [Roseateles koreensis]MDC8785705.1 prepilin-type N-terminal cleavage/methylation domain-containing protein [Roseateles koreensis]